MLTGVNAGRLPGVASRVKAGCVHDRALEGQVLAAGPEVTPRKQRRGGQLDGQQNGLGKEKDSCGTYYPF